MEEAYYGGYLEGLLNMASSESKYIGPSYIKVDCYKKKEFKQNFCKFYKIKEELKLIETNDSLDTTLLTWLGSKEIVENVCYWISIKNPGDKKVYKSEEKIVTLLDNQQKDFYSLEDLFFLETKEYIYVFLLGNNE